jgi:hypothetical protein
MIRVPLRLADFADLHFDIPRFIIKQLKWIANVLLPDREDSQIHTGE